MSCSDELAIEMRRKGFRVTAQRSIILETISHLGGHLSARQVYETASQRLPGLNIATVYRTVDSLQKAGLIETLSAGSEPDRFSLRDPSHPHGHLVCRICGTELELSPQQIQRLTVDVEQKTGFAIESDHLTLQGVCSECRPRSTT